MGERKGLYKAFAGSSSAQNAVWVSVYKVQQVLLTFSSL
jgi:hypothetical protein